MVWLDSKRDNQCEIIHAKNSRRDLMQRYKRNDIKDIKREYMLVSEGNQTVRMKEICGYQYQQRIFG